jgi:hypothetical protein
VESESTKQSNCVMQFQSKPEPLRDGFGSSQCFPLSIGRKDLLCGHFRPSRFGGEGRIRTSEGLRQQIYSLPPLAAREPLQLASQIITVQRTNRKPLKISMLRANSSPMRQPNLHNGNRKEPSCQEDTPYLNRPSPPAGSHPISAGGFR